MFGVQTPVATPGRSPHRNVGANSGAKEGRSACHENERLQSSFSFSFSFSCFCSCSCSCLTPPWTCDFSLHSRRRERISASARPGRDRGQCRRQSRDSGEREREVERDFSTFSVALSCWKGYNGVCRYSMLHRSLGGGDKRVGLVLRRIN